MLPPLVFVGAAVIVDDHGVGPAGRRCANEAVDLLAAFDGVVANAPGDRGIVWGMGIRDHALYRHPQRPVARADAGLIKQHGGLAVGVLHAGRHRIFAGKDHGIPGSRTERIEVVAVG
jgi:hypothetical protein